MKKNRIVLLFLITILLLIIGTEVLSSKMNLTKYISYIVVILTTILVNIKLKKDEKMQNIIIIDIIFGIAIFIFDPIVVSISQLISYIFYRKMDFYGDFIKFLLSFIVPIIILGALYSGYSKLIAKAFANEFSVLNYKYVFFVLVKDIITFNTILILSYKILSNEIYIEHYSIITMISVIGMVLIIGIASCKLYSNYSILTKSKKFLDLMQKTYNNNSVVEEYEIIKSNFYPMVNIEAGAGLAESAFDFYRAPNMVAIYFKQNIDVLVETRIDFCQQVRKKSEKQKIQREIQGGFNTCIEIYKTYIDNLHLQTKYIIIIYVINITYVWFICFATRKNKKQLSNE